MSLLAPAWINHLLVADGSGVSSSLLIVLYLSKRKWLKKIAHIDIHFYSCPTLVHE